MKPIHALLAALVLSISGCGGKLDTDEVIPIDRVPPAVLKAAQAKMPDVTFDTAYRDVYNGQPVYEIRGKTKNGKIRECEVNEKGEVVNVE